jgi:DivIVA domain-containing protein
MTELADATSAGSLTPAAVQAVTFRETRRLTPGYDEDEVDAFIDQVALAIQASSDRIGDLEAENTQLREQHSRVQFDQSASILETARRTAEDTMHEADDYSLRTVSEARALRDEATAAAQQIVEQARVECATLIEQCAELKQQITYLTKIRETTHAEIRGFIQSLVDRLDRIEDI